MITDISKNFRLVSALALIAITTASTWGSVTLANIIEPETKQAPAVQHANQSTTEVRQLLDKASLIAFEGASAAQKIQTQSVDHHTTEILKNYMASMVYVPRATSLPSDNSALDEPWLASTSGTSDGMVVPSLDAENDEPIDAKEIEIDIPSTSGKVFLKLLKPIPTALISSPFGFRWGRPHQGIDMAAPVGTPIVSAETGKVIFSGWKQGYGNFVAVNHGHGYETHYAHCSKVIVHAGQTVRKGQVIAKVGNTGHSTGPHLHFEVIASGVHRNPAKFLNQTLTVVQAH